MRSQVDCKPWLYVEIAAATAEGARVEVGGNNCRDAEVCVPTVARKAVAFKGVGDIVLIGERKVTFTAELAACKAIALHILCVAHAGILSIIDSQLG